MSFSENLKAIRQEKNISQEQLADMLNISRQAVSKWEQDGGYPETEKLIQIAQKLDVSLDALLLDKQLVDESSNACRGDIVVFPVDRKIMVQSIDGKTMSAFYKFRISKILFARKDKPQYMIYGTDSSNFFGDNIVPLGVYMTHEEAQKELGGINRAIQNSEASYQLKFNADIKLGGFNIIL